MHDSSSMKAADIACTSNGYASVECELDWHMHTFFKY